MTTQIENARERKRLAEDRQMRAMTIDEFVADQAIIDKAQDEIDLLERRRA
jgi:polyhydroxyalkanoate synthesis regulator phasin